MSLQITGKLIEKYPVQQVSEKFKKREFVIEISEDVNGQTYTNPAKFQCVQNRCDALDRHNIGDTVNVHFNIKGNKWEKDGKVNYITNLDCWRIEAAQGAGTPKNDGIPVYSSDHTTNGGSGYPTGAATATVHANKPPVTGSYAMPEEDTLPF